MLHRGSGAVEHRGFRDAPSYLRAGDVLVLNDTRVSARRLRGVRPSGGAVEALLVERVGPGLYDALVRPGRRMPPGATFLAEGRYEATVVEGAEAPMRRLCFAGDPDLGGIGEVPLPPYITERLDASTGEGEARYDTVYAERAGSAAAPTAGLHFTPEILREIEARGVGIARVTLHVGLDTFRPVEAEDLAGHRMHGELCEVSPEAAEAMNARRGRLVAVGTTSVRTVETFAGGDGRVAAGRTRSELFIRPGYRFRAVEGMFTNFHLPRTTMLAMISALAGYGAVRGAYAAAIEEGYRFLSFGDSMLIL